MGNICERAQDNLWGLYGKYLWEPKLGNNMESIWVIWGKYVGNICVGSKQLWACMSIFSEWTNEIRARKFGPQHLAPRVMCEQFLFGHTCEFESWWQL